MACLVPGLLVYGLQTGPLRAGRAGTSVRLRCQEGRLSTGPTHPRGQDGGLERQDGGRERRRGGGQPRVLPDPPLHLPAFGRGPSRPAGARSASRILQVRPRSFSLLMCRPQDGGRSGGMAGGWPRPIFSPPPLLSPGCSDVWRGSRSDPQRSSAAELEGSIQVCRRPMLG